LAIPAHPEDLLRGSNVDADPLMGVVGSRTADISGQGWLRREKQNDDN
jgi:hypothetical protein